VQQHLRRCALTRLVVRSASVPQRLEVS